MKTIIKIALLVLLAAVVIAATKPGDHPRKQRTDSVNKCYSQDDVHFLMDANGWSNEEASHVLDLACENAVTP